MPEEEKSQESTPKSSSRRWWRLLLVGFLSLIAVILVLTGLLLGWHEPQYQNHPLSYWFAELNGTNYLKSGYAADAIAKIGEPAMPAVLRALRQEHTLVDTLREKAIAILPAKLSRYIPKPLPLERRQFDACAVLAEMGPKAKEAIPDLVCALTNSSMAVVSQATYALGKMGTNAIPALLSGAKSSDLRLAAKCGDVLRNAGINVQLPKVTAAAFTSFMAARAVDANVLQLFLEQLQDSRSDAIRELQKILNSADQTTRTRAAMLLGRLGARDAKVTSLLLQGLQTGSKEERYCCLLALNPRDVPLADLMKLAEDTHIKTALYSASILDVSYGNSVPKWKLADRLIHEGADENAQHIINIFYSSLRGKRDGPEVVKRLSLFLASKDKKHVRWALQMIAEYPQALLPLKPEVQKLQPQQPGQGLEQAQLQFFTTKALDSLSKAEAATKP